MYCYGDVHLNIAPRTGGAMRRFRRGDAVQVTRVGRDDIRHGGLVMNSRRCSPFLGVLGKLKRRIIFFGCLWGLPASLQHFQIDVTTPTQLQGALAIA